MALSDEDKAEILRIAKLEILKAELDNITNDMIENDMRTRQYVRLTLISAIFIAGVIIGILIGIFA